MNEFVVLNLLLVGPPEALIISTDMSMAAYNSGSYIGQFADSAVGISAGHVESSGEKPVQRAVSEENGTAEPYVQRADDDLLGSQALRAALYKRFWPFILAGVAAVILGWWISSIILKTTRHRWYAYHVYLPARQLTRVFQDCPVSVCLVLYHVRMHFPFQFDLSVIDH